MTQTPSDLTTAPLKETTSAKPLSVATADLSNVLTSIFEAMETESAESFSKVGELPEVIQAVKAVRKGDPDRFFFALQYPFKRIVESLLKRELPNSHEARFIFEHSQFVENQFKTLIVHYEGSGCSSDKSSTVLKSLLRFFVEGKEIAFNYEQEYTFHLPVKVFRTHDEIVTFFKAVQRLHHGQPDLYIAALAQIHGLHNEKSSS